MAVDLDTPEQLAEVLGRTLNDVEWDGVSAGDYVDFNEVYPNLYLGNRKIAEDKAFLKSLGITHVLNTAMGRSCGMVNTNASFYGDEMKFLGFEMFDMPQTNITQYFDAAADFIESGLKNGKVYVHCLMGISRSSTCIIAFLMIKKNHSAEEALRIVRARRWIAPNEGFLRQLARLDFKLRDNRPS